MNYYFVVFILGALAFDLSYSATVEMEVPPDVQQFENFVQDFEDNRIRLAPTALLFMGNFPLTFEEMEHGSRRLKRDVDTEPTEPGQTEISEDDLVKHYVQNEINRIFSCYQRLRCGYTRAQAERECQWLEHSSLYHQIMKVLGIRNYPKKFPAAVPVQSHPSHARGQIQSDAAINPAHRNLQNGIRYGGARPERYLQNGYTARNRRAYDSFFTNQELTPLQGSSTT